MNKLTKLFILFALVILITIFIQSLSQLLTAIITPPLVMSTVILMILISMNEKIDKNITILLLLIIAVSLTSTGVGIHYTANEINNLISDNSIYKNIINNLDENFSHYIIFSGIVFLIATIYLLFKNNFLKFEYELEKIVLNAKKMLKLDPTINFKDYLIASTTSSFVGVMFAFISIEANVEIYGIILSLISLFTILITRWNNIKTNFQTLTVIFICVILITYITTILSFNLALFTKYATSLKQII